MSSVWYDLSSLHACVTRFCSRMLPLSTWCSTLNFSQLSISSFPCCCEKWYSRGATASHRQWDFVPELSSRKWTAQCSTESGISQTREKWGSACLFKNNEAVWAGFWSLHNDLPLCGELHAWQWVALNLVFTIVKMPYCILYKKLLLFCLPIVKSSAVTRVCNAAD